MADSREAASRRLVERVLKRAGLSECSAPTLSAWGTFLDLTRGLLADQQQERYLLEQSLEMSSQEMLSLYEDLRASAEQLSVDREELRNANSVLTATLESTVDGILVVDAVRHITTFNQRFAEMWGIPLQILDSRDDQDALTFVEHQLRDPEAFTAKVEQIYQTPDVASHDTLDLEDGRVFEQVSLPQRVDGEVVGRVWSFRDITTEHQLNRELQHRALHDSLTGLANRAAFDDRLHQALRRLARSGGDLAVVVMDLDGFKHINDSLGHLVGDAVLVAIADRFRSTFRDFDTIARLGGDEFALLVEDIGSPEQAARLGQRLLDMMVAPVDLGERQVAIGASIGISLVGGTAEPEHLLAQSDTAMYRAKQNGKGRYELFESSMHIRAVERLNLEQALRAAVTSGDLNVHYQPVVEALTGQVVSFEALARWHDPERGFVPPDVFIPLAEETGLIHVIGRTVLLEACRQGMIWHATYPQLRCGIAVNVSGHQLLEPTFERTVREILTRTGLDPHLLTLEITESVLANDSARVIATLEQLRELGIRVAIDDFGTGHSSFAVLADLPVDTLKIDKRFVDGLLRDRRGHGLIEAIVGIADTLELSTIAEGAEQPEQQQALNVLGCQYIQGYLFARPMPAGQALEYLERQHRSNRLEAAPNQR